WGRSPSDSEACGFAIPSSPSRDAGRQARRFRLADVRPPPDGAAIMGGPPGTQTNLSVALERECVKRAAAGEQEAIGLLYDAYIVRLYRYCLARVGNET